MFKFQLKTMIRGSRIGLIALAAFVGAAAAQPNDLVCLSSANQQSPDARGSVQGLMDDMEPVFRAFPQYRDLIYGQAVDICLSASLPSTHGYFSPDRNSIVLQSDLPRPFQVAILIHELRHLQQYASGICPTDSLAMTELARATLALEADASAISLFVANALSEAGRPEAWEALSAWPNQQDIAAAFSEELAASGDPRRATTAAFAQWYASSWRRNNYYRAACSAYLDRQDETKALPQYDEVAADFLDRLCRMPDGSPYECTEASDILGP